MQLTKLEIKGFKSFGDKVSIHFDKGITGIVGPNGCGKSNVVDAIRWVLGEQKTRALRSDKMENVIFNGTRTRKPSQMAEVSLTFDNTRNLLPTEYAQVTITRRYYRSGESEYELNGVPCRLKDITNLFMDTGIASNSYAIIELKMVDELLNDKEGSRRALIEEAAGISKFKSRKKETLRKLQDTDTDLDRVEDLLFEIEKNLKSLERQAKQAERYFKLKEEYKDSSLRLARLRISAFTDQFLSLQKSVEAERDRRAALDAQTGGGEAAIEAAKADVLVKEKTLVSRQKTLNEHVNNIRQQESEKKIKNERLRFLQDKRDTLREQLSLDKQSNERAAFSIQSLQQEAETAEKLLNDIRRELEDFRETYEDQKAKLNELRSQSSSAAERQRMLQNQAYQLNKELEIKQMQLTSLRQELEKNLQAASAQTSDLSGFEDKLADIHERLSDKKAEYAAAEEREQSLQDNIAGLEERLTETKDMLAQTNRRLDARQNEYQLTKSLVENLEGFPEAIKYLKKKTDWGKDVPLLSDVFTCADAYRPAIENYLEPYMNYYVTDTFQQAYEAVQLLEEAQRGRAHFFVLEALQVVPPQVSVKAEGIAALDILEYEPRYEALARYLFGQVYLAEAEKIKAADPSTASWLSLDGKLIRRSVQLTGGSLGMFEGKRIGRAKNLKALEEEVASLQEEHARQSATLQELQQQLSTARASVNKTALQQLQKELSEFQQEYVSLQARKEQFAQMLSSQAMRRDEMEQQLAELQEEHSNLLPEAEAAAENLKDVEQMLASLNQQMQYENEHFTQVSSRFNEQNLRMHQQENSWKSLLQEISFKQQSYETSQERIGKNQEVLLDTEAEIEALLNRNEIGDEELLALYKEKEAIEQGVNEAERSYYESRARVDEQEKLLRELQRQRETSQNLLLELQNKQSESKLELNSLRERLSVEFEVDADALMEQAAEVESQSEQELREAVRSAKDRLEKIGPINPMAMEAYQEISERHTFIRTQRDDLRQAKASLLDTMEQIDTAARDAFLTAFAQIKENFVRVFRSLFTEEDDCDLRLVDPENPLESPIDIMAKPKGKRPLTINQLSGGEKTLTATSLLFSIYLLKPAPFCIFDEVDAPLDDANIDKFNNIIRKFSSESQFIIVTHNKRTMASTDIMYGVTMLEMGVSRVVPVDLRDLATEHA